MITYPYFFHWRNKRMSRFYFTVLMALISTASFSQNLIVDNFEG